MDAAATSPLPIVLCALEFERKALHRAGIDSIAELNCIGPGPDAMVRWAEKRGEHAGLIVLAGLAGALRPSVRVRQAAVIGTVIGDDGRRFGCPAAREISSWLMHSDAAHDSTTAPPLAVIASSASVLTSASAKRAIATKTGAELVDQESGAFALAAGILGWRWLIIKGVSDGPDTRLPGDIDRWVDSAGHQSVGRLAMSLALRPWNLPRVVRLGRDASAAMQAVASLVHRVLAAAQHDLLDDANADQDSPNQSRANEADQHDDAMMR